MLLNVVSHCTSCGQYLEYLRVEVSKCWSAGVRRRDRSRLCSQVNDACLKMYEVLERVREHKSMRRDQMKYLRANYVLVNDGVEALEA